MSMSKNKLSISLDEYFKIDNVCDIWNPSVSTFLNHAIPLITQCIIILAELFLYLRSYKSFIYCEIKIKIKMHK